MNPGQKVDILIIGRGAREHALAWKLRQSPRAGEIYIAPGNGGTETVGKNVSIMEEDIAGLVKFAREKHIGLTVVGPETPLARGIVNTFEKEHLRIFGPTKDAARIETSKAFAKEIMQEAKIPTAAYRVFNEHDQARAYVQHLPLPIVIKASGLAGGQGVFICESLQMAESALDEIMVQKKFGAESTEVVIEEFLVGVEISVHALCDGINYALFPSAQDHKRIGEGNTGKNTGGMGAIAPVPWVDEVTMVKIERVIIKPLLEALAYRGTPFKGVLFPGVMITASGPKVIEFNTRFGDPETQAYMRLMESDLLDHLEACVDGTIGNSPPRWGMRSAAAVVMVSGGYPDAYKEGLEISGIKDVQMNNDIVVFHGGTIQSDILSTAGGRVLTVTAPGSPLGRAVSVVYKAVEKIHFEGQYFRRDIGTEYL